MGRGYYQMASCKQVLGALTEYLEGDLDNTAQDQFEGHMDGCRPCVAFFRTYRRSSELARQALTIETVPAELQERVRRFLSARLGIEA